MEIDIKALQEATAGAVGGLISTTILYPLDTCKTRYQAEAQAGALRQYSSTSDVFRQALKNRELLSLYQGLHTKNFHGFVSGFVYFYSYQWMKRQYLNWSGVKQMGAGANLVVAAAAGVVNCIIIQPLDTASARMQTSEPGKAKSLWRTLREGTLSEAYDGLGASLLLVSNPAIQYTVFEQLRDRALVQPLERRSQAKDAAILAAYAAGMSKEDALAAGGAAAGQSPSLSALMAFGIGAIAKTVATICTYPAIRVKIMLQAAQKSKEGADGDRPRNMIQALHQVLQKEGPLGLYKGLEAQIVKTVLAAALMLMIKEKTGEATVAVFMLFGDWSKSRKPRTTFA